MDPAYHAKYALTGDLEGIQGYPSPVALVPPSFYGQFDPETGPAVIRAGLEHLGFNKVYDVTIAAEAVSRKTADFLRENSGLYISSSCPVVVRLIQLSYPELLEQLMPINSPVEIMAGAVKKRTLQQRENTGDRGGEEPAVFFLTPCPAKATTVINPPGMESSFLDGTIAVEKVYRELLERLKELTAAGPVYEDKLSGDKCQNDLYPWPGLKWGRSGGEEELLKPVRDQGVMSVSGIQNVKLLLEEVSRNNLRGLKYLELNACPGGCVGGVLNVINPFQAAYNLRRLTGKRVYPVERPLIQADHLYNYSLSRGFKAVGSESLDENLEQALEKYAQMERELGLLPGLDCAACGAPDCQTLAEDIVNGLAERSDCTFVLREQVGELADTLSRLAHALPPVMGRRRGVEEQ